MIESIAEACIDECLYLCPRLFPSASFDAAALTALCGLPATYSTVEKLKGFLCCCPCPCDCWAKADSKDGKLPVPSVPAVCGVMGV